MRIFTHFRKISCIWLLTMLVVWMLACRLTTFSDLHQPESQVISISPSPPLLPVPTSAGLPPTLTPPPLQAWPTPTSTPLSGKAEQARQFIAKQEDISPDRLEFLEEMAFSHPLNGGEFWVIRFLDTETSYYHKAVVDPSGRADYLPDLSEAAKVYLAKLHDVSPEQLLISNIVYATFPYTHQIVWRAKFLDTGGSEVYEATLDIAGNPVDIAAIELTEETARQTRCPKLDESLCLTLLQKSPEELQAVLIFLQETADSNFVVQHLEQAGYEYRLGQNTISAQLPKHLIVELGTFDQVSHIFSDWPDKTVPLDSNLIFFFEEANGQITLKLQTEKIYICYNYGADAQLSQSTLQELEIDVNGIYMPQGCAAAIGPANSEINLGQLQGQYKLAFVYENLRDEYRLFITPQVISLESIVQTFTWPTYGTWLRLPPDSIWFVAEARTVDRGTLVVVDRSAYEAQVEDFFTALEALDAKSFIPPENVYSNRWFVPPWPAWRQKAEGDNTQIPLDDQRTYLFKWPDIRYYYYSGSMAQIETLIQDHNSPIVFLRGYTWQGDNFYPKKD